MNEYLVILERGETSWGAYSPDVLGCVAVGKTRDEAYRLYQEALQEHLDWAREEGDVLPNPHSETAMVTLELAERSPKTYLVILEPEQEVWSASAADIPDFVITRSTREDALRNLQTALPGYLQYLQAAGQAVPDPASEAITLIVRVNELAVAA
ncbi:MAG: type II toxin-antitoxin system HicB family antitoxin [Armatimonadota bacterium]|nr:type II toxin-antitoxin system HicB family antitoxin [Armatimonadota bacterium]